MKQSLTALDVATGTMVRCPSDVQPLPDCGGAPRDVLDEVLLPALLRPPCLVSFSGGRDSSAVLAAATSLARREGLELPIPATNVFPGAIYADETPWQETVVSHLGLSDWLRVSHRKDLDVVGPYARRIMRRHGLLLPFNVHFHLPLLDAGQGGSLLTGIGGDELFTASRAPRSPLDGRLRGLPRGLARLGLSRAPAPLRRAVHRRREPCELPWLRAEAQRSLTAASAELAVREPRSLHRRMQWWRSFDYLGEGKLGLVLTGQDSDVLVVHPLLAPTFWSAVGRLAEPYGFHSRTDGMTRLFDDLLPADVLARPTKAHFNEAMWTDSARRFAHDWDGSGVPEECVDTDALRRHWQLAEPSAHSFTLLQAAWIAQAGNRFEERFNAALV